MSILVRFAQPGTSPEQYDEVLPKIEQASDQWPPDGMEYHCCFKVDGGDLNVSEIWDSQQQFEAFGATLMPILEEAGIDAGQPTILEIHNTIRR